MSTILDKIIKRKELLQTDEFNDLYNSYLETELNENFYSVYSADHINDLFSSIINQHKNDLTTFQKRTLQCVFTEFDKIQKLIDPARLKEFQYSISNEAELLLYRKTKIGLSNLIIDDEGEVAFSFIPFESALKSSLEYFEEDNLEKPVLLLFSR